MDIKQAIKWVRSVCKFAEAMKEETIEEDVAKDVLKESPPAQQQKKEMVDLLNKATPKVKPQLMPIVNNPSSAKALHQGLEKMQDDPTALIRMKNQLKNNPLEPTKKGPGPFATDRRKP
jgi:hypothetical protein